MAEWKPKNQFCGHISPNINDSIEPIVSKNIRVYHAPTIWISWKSIQNCDLYRAFLYILANFVLLKNVSLANEHTLLPFV